MTHEIKIEQISRLGKVISAIESKFEIENKRYEGVLWIDSPSENTSYTRPDESQITVSGWAVSDDKEARIKIMLDEKVVEENAQRITRNDVSKIFADSYGGTEVTPQAGYKKVVDISNLEQGIHTIQVQQISRYGQILSSRKNKNDSRKY